MLASMFRKRASSSASKHKADESGTWANTSAPAAATSSSTGASSSSNLPRSSSESSVLSNLLHAHPNLSVFRNSTRANKTLPSSPSASPTPSHLPSQTEKQRSTPQRSSVKGLFLQRSHSMESLRGKASGGAAAELDDETDTFFTPSAGDSKENERGMDRSPLDTPDKHRAVRSNRSPYSASFQVASRSTPDVSALSSPSSSSQDPFVSFHRLEAVPSGTPASKKGILRDPGRGTTTPGTGSSVRFFSRDNVHILSPDPTTTSPDSSTANMSPATNGNPTASVDDSSSTSVASREAGDPSLFASDSQMLATPLQNPVSSSFLDRLHGVSPATPLDSSDNHNSPEMSSTTPTRQPTARRSAKPSLSSHLPSSPSTLLSMDMLDPPCDVSDLRDITNRLPTDGASLALSYEPSVDNIPTPTSNHFPYQELESSVSSGHALQSAEEHQASDSTLTITSPAVDTPSSQKGPLPQRLFATQSSLSSVLDFYSSEDHYSSADRPPSTLPSAQPSHLSSTPGRASASDVTIYHTPRSDLQLRILQMEMGSPTEDLQPQRLDSEVSLSRSLVDRGLFPGQLGSPSVILSFLQDNSFDSSPITPSLVSSFPAAPMDDARLLVPSADLASLNVEFNESHLHLLTVTQKKYDLQLQISDELETTLRRKEKELKALKGQMERMGEVRDLEVRLSMQREEAQQARDAFGAEARLKEEAQARAERLEVEVRDLRVRESADVNPQPTAGSSDDVRVADQVTTHLQSQVDDQLQEIKRLASRLVDSVLAKDAALQQVAVLEEEAVVVALSKKALDGKLADRERVVARLEAKLEKVDAESTEGLQQILSSHHQQTADLHAQMDALQSEVTSLRAAPPTTAVSNSLVVALAAARRDLERANERDYELVKLQHHRDQLVQSLQSSDDVIDGLQAELEAVQAERDDLAAERDQRADFGGNEEWIAEREDLIAERDSILEEKEELLAQLEDHAQVLADKIAEVEELDRAAQSTEDRHSLEMEQLKRVRAANVDLVASKEHYVDKTASLQDQVEGLRTTLDSKAALVVQLQSRLDELESSTYGIVNDARVALEEACHQRDKKIRSLQRVLKEKEQSISALEEGREDISRRYNSLVAEQASASIDAQTSSFRLNAEDGELERLTKEIARLKSADAAKEVRIVHLTRSRDEVRETLEGVEIALDSKQQELELVKRKFGVKGVGGCTPAPNRTTPSSISISRRHSLAPATPSISSSASVGPRSSLGGALETPAPFRSRSSLAMGTPGLAHLPSASRPRSSLGVPTPSTTSKLASSARGSRLSMPSVPQESPAPQAFSRTGRQSTSLAPASSSKATKVPLGNSFAANTATPRRSSTSANKRPLSSALPELA